MSPAASMPGPAVRGLAAAVVTLLVLLTAPAPAAAPAEEVPDESRAYARARAVEVVERRVLGRSVRGRPITAYRKGNPGAARTVLLLGQMHGDEPGGPVTARWVRDRLPVDSDVDLWIVPTMNPDGAARGTRINARGVDLNRNWPTSGWRAADDERGSRTWRGPRPASEPEVRAMIAFLRDVEPELITSLHQPYGSVGRNGKTPRYVRRLSRELGLPVETIGVGTPSPLVPPTLTSWFNERFRGGAVTVEFTARPSRDFLTRRAGRGILRANLADW